MKLLKMCLTLTMPKWKQAALSQKPLGAFTVLHLPDKKKNMLSEHLSLFQVSFKIHQFY